MRGVANFIAGFATEVTLSALKVVNEAIRDRLPSVLATDRLKVDGSGVTQPVSGTVAISGTPSITGAVTVTSGAITETNSAAILAKIITAPATAALQGAGLPLALGASGGIKVDGSGTALPISGSVTATISGTPAVTVSSGAITETNSAAILAKIITAPATEAKQDTGNAFLSTLAGIVSAGKALVTETSAAAILAKLSADPSTATLQSTINTSITNLRAQITTTLGQAARASCLGVTLSTEDAAKVPSLGQAIAASCSPVVLPATQCTGVLALDATLTGGTAVVIAKGAAATGAAVSGNPVYVGGKDGSGNAQPLLTNVSGVVQVQTGKGTSSSSTAVESSRVISASACMVARISMLNGSASNRFLLAFNATSLPANGAVPVGCTIVGTTQTQLILYAIPTDRFSTGCVVATSTTSATLTLGSADALFQVDLYPTNV